MIIAALFAILAITAVLPLFVKTVEENLEIFLCVMGLMASTAAGALTPPSLASIFQNPFLYLITAAVLAVSILFRILEDKVNRFFDFLLKNLPLKLVVLILVAGLGILSSVITAVIAALLLCEILLILPLNRKNTVRLAIIASFSIGLGAILTPVGEPLSTIAVSNLHGDFGYMIRLLGFYAVPGIVLLALFATLLAEIGREKAPGEDGEPVFSPEKETGKAIVLRAVKIFIFVVGLELLGHGFAPVIDAYVIHWNDKALYFANMGSAILDNATLAAAEISPAMGAPQIRAILMSLLVSGGMLITGNIPNIVTAGKLKISMKEWAKFGVPIGLALLSGYYVALFAF